MIFGKLSGLLESMGNSKGSQVIPQIYKVRKNIVLEVSDEQLSIIVGSILGDAYVHPLGKICFEQSTSQKDYLLWKFDKLKNLAYPKIAYQTRFDKRYNKENHSYRFFLKQFFRPLRQIFYVNHKKIVPDCLTNVFNPLVLAVWYMDDGCLEKGHSPTIATESFSDEEIVFLSDLTFQKFKLENLITSRRRIRIKDSSTNKFFHLVEP